MTIHVLSNGKLSLNTRHLAYAVSERDARGRWRGCKVRLGGSRLDLDETAAELAEKLGDDWKLIKGLNPRTGEAVDLVVSAKTFAGAVAAVSGPYTYIRVQAKSGGATYTLWTARSAGEVGWSFAGASQSVDTMTNRALRAYDVDVSCGGCGGFKTTVRGQVGESPWDAARRAVADQICALDDDVKVTEWVATVGDDTWTFDVPEGRWDSEDSGYPDTWSVDAV